VDFSEVRLDVSRPLYYLSNQLKGAIVRDDQENSRLPPGYRLDLIEDPCVIVLRGPDGIVVARFTHNVDPEEIRRAAQEDYERPSQP
jgi:hypothetical protein